MCPIRGVNVGIPVQYFHFIEQGQMLFLTPGFDILTININEK